MEVELSDPRRAEAISLLQGIQDIVRAYEESQEGINPHVEFDVLGSLTANIEKEPLHIPKGYKQAFFSYVDHISLALMEDKNNFYGYFYLQMDKDIRLDLASPTGVAFKRTKYVMYFNPLLFLAMRPEQMETSMRHEILHILSQHLWRAKDLGAHYSKLAINLAMDLVVNTYAGPSEDLPPDAVTLPWVNRQFNLALSPYKTFEYYLEELQKAIQIKDSLDATGLDVGVLGNQEDSQIQMNFNPNSTHDIWEECQDTPDETIQQFTETFIDGATKGDLEGYLGEQVKAFKEGKESLPWHYYLKKIVASVVSDRRRTTTRRNRRQPERLDLAGTLPNHRAKIFVALDISGSISDSEFSQAMDEVFQLVNAYNHEIVVIECDNAIRRSYKVKSLTDLQERPNMRAGTAFSPAINYANKHRIDLLVYFTDGEGEEYLRIAPKGYKILWVLTGKSQGLSLKKPYGLVKKLHLIDVKDDTVDFADLRVSGFSMANQPKDGELG